MESLKLVWSQAGSLVIINAFIVVVFLSFLISKLIDYFIRRDTLGVIESKENDPTIYRVSTVEEFFSIKANVGDICVFDDGLTSPITHVRCLDNNGERFWRKIPT